MFERTIRARDRSTVAAIPDEWPRRSIDGAELPLVVGGFHQGFAVPWWVILLSAGALSAGTYSGGWRIMRTLGRRIIDLDPPRGFAAEATASAVLYTTAFAFAAPISTTQTITSSILGVGAYEAALVVRWGSPATSSSPGC